MTTTSLTFPSPVGPLLAIAHDDELAALRFDGGPLGGDSTPLLRETAAQVDAYFAGERVEFDLPLAQPAEPFLRGVVEILARIPYGQTASYGDVTAELGLPMAEARRVGATVGRNPLAIVVPCHRVIGADGSLTGFGGGLRRKAQLLDLEARQLTLDLAV
jgi:methylated-DNA-[protein]-cysteine S-methyltransferase